MSEQRRRVLDASAALHVVMRLPTAEPIIDKLEQATLVLVPQHYFSKTANALWKCVSHNQLFTKQAIERYQDVCTLPDQAISDQTLALEALSLASTNNGLTLYTHNPLYGRWLITADDEYPVSSHQLRLAIHTGDHAALLYGASDIM